MLRFAVPIRVVLIVAAVMIVTGHPLDVHASVSTAAVSPQCSTMSVNGSLGANTSIQIVIEGAPPPNSDGLPPFGLGVRLNGWIATSLPATWNPESQTWTVSYHLPSGHQGSFCEIIFTSDKVITRSFTIR